MTRRVLLFGLVLAAGCTRAAAGDVQLQFGRADGKCTVTADGRTMTLEAAAAQFRQWRGREIHLRGEPEAQIGCLAPLISALRRAGVRRIGFISEPEAGASRGDAK